MPRHSRRHRSRSRRMIGGGATEFVQGVVGSENAQFSRVFDQAGAYGQVPGNIIIGAQGQNVQPSTMVPTQTQLALIQNGSQLGGRRRRSSRARKGGFLGEVVNQAIVPFALVGMQNTYRRRKGGRSRRTRRRGRR